MDTKANSRSEFNEYKLPWILAAAALVLYLVTLNHWVTTTSLAATAKVTDWDWWSLTLQAPLFYLITYPVRWLPAAWQPLVLNLFSAFCAAATVGLLAKSVVLLPHDRTRDQRTREHSEFSLLSVAGSWAPPLLAALAFGLQLTFWEHATAATGETLNLLLFAYIICCLLEFRLEQEDTQLYKAALAYGLAMTNNWAMIPFLPLFIGAVIWIKGLAFFDFRFLSRMLGLGCAGLLLYLLLPITELISAKSNAGFWELLKYELIFQRNYLFMIPRPVVLLCALSSLLPVLVMGVRWPSSVGDTSIFGNIMTLFMFRIIHILFLGVCAWVMFDPPFSPRVRGLGLPFLTFYYLSALGIGYFSGYFLLVFGTEPEKRRHRSSDTNRLLNRLLASLVWIAVIGVPAGLIYKNWPQIQDNNGPYLAKAAQALTANLPDKGAILVSDDPLQLLLVQAEFARRGGPHNHIIVDTRSLGYKAYHHTMRQRYGQRWPSVLTRETFSDPIENTAVLHFVGALALSNEVYYVHPPINQFMEGLYVAPMGMVYRVQSYQRGQIVPPPLSTNAVAFNQAFWARVKADLANLPKPANWGEAQAGHSDAIFASQLFSRSANWWGVEMQRNNYLQEAGQAFVLALEINPNNEVAQVNRKYNQNLAAGRKGPVELEPAFEENLTQKYRRWEELVRLNGPFDEPRFCKKMGENFATAEPSYIRQSAQSFLRVLSLDPANLEAAVWLANMYLKWHLPEKTLEVVGQLRRQQATQPLSLTTQHELVRLEAWAYTLQTNLVAAVKVLQDAQVKDPGEPSLPETLSQIYLQGGDFTNALAALEQQLKLDPNNMKALFNQGALSIQIQQYARAIPALTRVLESEPKNEAARLNRAIACLQSGDLDGAERDYQILLDLMPNYYRAYYGLGEAAQQRKDTAKAIRYYESYLKHAPRDTAEARKVAQNLEALKSGKGSP